MAKPYVRGYADRVFFGSIKSYEDIMKVIESFCNDEVISLGFTSSNAQKLVNMTKYG